MEHGLRFAVPVLWLSWLLYWAIAARNVKATKWVESTRSRLSYILPLYGAGFLMTFRNATPAFLRQSMFPHTSFTELLSALVVGAGLGFSIWARRHLGTNWSGTVTVKEGHSLIRTGPYRFVRHPIYTGLLVAFIGTAMSIGEWRGAVAAVLAGVSLYIKLTAEEARMRETFPDYEDYRRRTAALIPFIL